MTLRNVLAAFAAILAAICFEDSTRADFILTGTQQMTINTDISNEGSVSLKGYSQLSVVSGGKVNSLYAFGWSTVNISGGSVQGSIRATDYSTVYISGGSVNQFYATEPTVLSYISGGSVSKFVAWGNINISGGTLGEIWANGGALNISGGTLSNLEAINGSVILNGIDFVLGPGLSLNGNQVQGLGLLSGEWSDGTPWMVDIGENDANATITIPEPATISLLGLGLAATILSSRRRSF